MEAQLQRPSHGHHHQEATGQHSAVEGEGQGEHHHHHGEKKSVLKKVKEKAKKMKDAIKKHGHHTHAENEGEEDPEVHGAPIYESTVVRSRDLPSGTNPDLEKPPEGRALAPESEMAAKTKIDQSLEEDPHSPNNSPAKISSSNHGGEEAKNVADRAQSSEVSHDTIAGKMLSATVASKLGDDQDSSSNKPLSQKVAETLAPVYEKVAGAGSAVVSMVQGSEGSGNGGGDIISPAVKEYVSEKFRPGDEDKKLSEAITDAFHKKKEAVWGTEEEEQQQEGGKGKVTVSKEVAERLGTVPESKREGEDALRAGEESSGQGVAERMKDAVGSWLGKSCGIQTAEESVGNAFVNNKGSGPR